MGVLRRFLGFLRELDEGMARMRDLAPLQHGLPPDPFYGAALRELAAEVSRGAGGGIAARVGLYGADAGRVDVGLHRARVLTVSGIDGRGAFRCSLVLPEEVAVEEVRAVVHGDVLWVTAPGTGGEAGSASGKDYPVRLRVERA